jgi:ribonuclease HI
MYLLTDGSVDPKSGIGFGAYLTFSGILKSFDSLTDQVKVRRFEKTSSTRLEIQTLLWALSEIPKREIISYTDSQNIAGLLSRKERLIKNGYCTKSGKLIRNHELYKDFFAFTEKIDIQFCLISGHKPSHSKDQIDRIFSIVDRASRKALRIYMKSNFQQVD